MESAWVVVVVCALSCCFGLEQKSRSTYCQKEYNSMKYTGYIVRYVNVCQANSASVGLYGWLVLDAAAAPPQQDITCKCYLSFVHSQQYVTVGLSIDVYGDQNAYYVANGTVYNKTSYLDINITSEIEIVYRHGKQDHHPRVCMGIRKGLAFRVGIFKVRCEPPVASTTETGARTGKTATRSMPGKTATRSMSGKTATRPMPEKTATHISGPATEETTSDQPGTVAGVAVGAVIVLAGIVITMILVWRRKYSGNNVDNPVNLHAGGQHAKAENIDLQLTHATKHTETSETDSIYIYEDIELYPKSPEVSPASTDAQYVYSYAAENMELESAERSEYENCFIVTTQQVAARAVGPQLARSTRRRIDVNAIKLERSLESSRKVPEASIDTQYLYDDTGFAFGDMASALYTNDDNGEKDAQLSEEGTCREHLDTEEGKVYEDFEIITRQQAVTRDHILPTRATTGIDAYQTNCDELDLA